MASLNDLKKLLSDVVLGSKAYNKAADLGNALKAYDPDLDVLQDSLVTTKVLDAMKARREAMAAKLSDYKAAVALGEHATLENICAVLDEMAAAKVKKMTPEYLTQLNDARKKDLLAIDTTILQPAIAKFLKKHQQRYDFVGGKLVPRDEEEEEEGEGEDAVDPAVFTQAEKDTDEIMTVMANRDTLLGKKTPLDAADVKSFTKDKLSFLPGALRGDLTKKLLAAEKNASAKIAEFDAIRAKTLAVFNDAHDSLKHNGKIVRSGPLPMFLWSDRAKFVAQMNLLKASVKEIRGCLDDWYKERTTARLDLKSKKVAACARLATQVDDLFELYKKLI